MDMRGQQHILADRDTVWNALNDPEILRVCIPGCQELTKTSDTEMTAVAVIKVGPIRARFQGNVKLSDLDPPNGYKISGEGQGGVAGFAKGTADVRLEAVEDGTLLYYEVDAQIGGKLSQLGGRLVDATAKKMSGAFFEKFGQEILARHAQSISKSTDTASVHESGSGGTAASKIDLGVTDSSHTVVPSTRPGQTPPTKVASGVFSFLKLVAAAVLGGMIVIIWLQYGGLQASSATVPGSLTTSGEHPVSADFAAAVQLIMAVAIGYLFGIRSYRYD